VYVHCGLKSPCAQLDQARHVTQLSGIPILVLALDECNRSERAAKLNLGAYLLEPIQRLPRFKLLLQGGLFTCVYVRACVCVCVHVV
jgi:hypothetical protein